jgi:SM-20-related protein
VPSFLAAAGVAALAADCRALDAAAALTPASTGREAGRRQAGLRGDRTRWFEPDALSPPQAAYWQTMDALRRGLNERLLLGLETWEAHYALYPPGAGYARHRDRFRDDDARVLSSVCYLNDDWHPGDGGALRLHLADGAHDVMPLGGTLALFLSAEIEHEVLPATRERLSIAGWFRRRELVPR